MGLSQVVGLALMVLLVGAGAYFVGGAAGTGTTRTVSAVSTITVSLERTSTLTQTTTATDTLTFTLNRTVSRSINRTVTSVSSTVVTRTLGTGITVTDYRLYMTNVLRDSILKLNLTVNFATVQSTDVVVQAFIVLTPSGGSSNDIKFIPNPIITRVSGSSVVFSMFTIIDHQIISGTYIIEYSISTSQGGALVFTVLEIA